MSRIEELENAIKTAEELSYKFTETCCKVSCNDCILKEASFQCAATKHRVRLREMKAELENEKKKASSEMEIENMIRALHSVKRDDWEIVKIAYPDNTKAVAFIKKGSDIQENMEEVKEEKKDCDNYKKSRLSEAFRIANELEKTACPLIDCKKCPFGTNTTDGLHACLSILARRQLERLGKEPEND